MSNILNISQAASYLGVSKDTLRRWEKKGKLKAFRSPSNRRLYHQSTLDKLLTPSKTSSAKEKPAKSNFQAQIITINIVAVIIIIFLLLALIQYFSQ